jgi:hypothetical protein
LKVNRIRFIAGGAVRWGAKRRLKETDWIEVSLDDLYVMPEDLEKHVSTHARAEPEWHGEALAGAGVLAGGWRGDFFVNGSWSADEIAKELTAKGSPRLGDCHGSTEPSAP